MFQRYVQFLRAVVGYLWDRDFGKLQYVFGSRWNGRVYFAPLSRELLLEIRADSRGPTPDQRTAYREFESHFEEIWPEIQERLYDQYQAICESHPDHADRPKIVTSDEILTVLWPFAVDILSSSTIDLLFASDFDEHGGNQCFHVYVHGMSVDDVRWERATDRSFF